MGHSVISNDTASDIRGDYVDLLRRGNSNEEALKKLMEKDGDCIGIEEEEHFLVRIGRYTVELWSADTGSKRKGIVFSGSSGSRAGTLKMTVEVCGGMDANAGKAEN